MALTAAVENHMKTSYDIKDATDVLFGKLDEAIDDIENGRTLSSEEMWREIDEI